MSDKMSEKELLETVVERRNAYLLSFFKKMLPHRIVRIMGDKNKPAVVIDDEFIAACYASNFQLRLLDDNEHGAVVMCVKLKEDTVLEVGDDDMFHSWLNNAKHKKAYRVVLDVTMGSITEVRYLFLSGWNVHKDDKGVRYPVFASYDPKIYFSEEKAKEVSEALQSQHYDSKII